MSDFVCIVTRTDDYISHAFDGQRMNKNHKWIARKRGPNGKWIYDYGNGFPGEGKRKRSFSDLKYDSSDYVKSNGHKVYKDETGQAYIKRKTYNPYVKNVYGVTPSHASNKLNYQLQKKQHSIKAENGRRYVY